MPIGSAISRSCARWALPSRQVWWMVSSGAPDSSNCPPGSRLMAPWPVGSTSPMMRPASTFEKWLLSALTLLVLYPLLYTAVFAAVNAVAGELGYRMALAAAQKMSNADMGADWRTSVDVADFVTFVPLRPHPSVLKLLSLPAQAAWAIVYVTMMAYAALGLVVFRRHAAMRTLVTAIGLCILTFLLMAGFHDSVNWRAVSAWWLSPDEREGLAPAAFVYSWAFWAGIPLLLGAASYRALREKDLS